MTRGVRLLVAAAVLAHATVEAGCSLFLVKAPTVSRAYSDGSECTTSPVPPLIDLLVSAWQVVRFAGAADEEGFREDWLSRGAVMVTAGALLAAFGTSAVYGFTHTHECKERQAGVAAPPRVTRARPSSPSHVAPPSSPAPTVQVIPVAPGDGGTPSPGDGGVAPPASQIRDDE
jgi:hypothetical protein